MKDDEKDEEPKQPNRPTQPSAQPPAQPAPTPAPGGPLVKPRDGGDVPGPGKEPGGGG